MSNNKQATLILHGTDLSQPCRTVSWLLRMHNVPFEYEQVIPGSRKGTKSPEFIQKMNKFATVPVLEHKGAILTESAAIIVYLAEVFKWEDVYPLGPEQAAKRAEINSWLHWAHRNSREFTIGLFAPLLRKDIKFTPEKLKELRAVCTKTAKVLDQSLATSGGYLCGAKPTLADFAVFADIGQCSKEDLDLFDFAPYSALSAWIVRMKGLPGYAETHEALASMRPMIDQAKQQAAKL